jgi:hypothetical protein
MIKGSCASIIALALLAGSVCAATVTLDWDASVDAGCSIYVVYQGTTPGVYTRTYNVGNPCSAGSCAHSFDGVGSGTYYYSVRCQDAQNNRSPYSENVPGVVP